MSGHDATFILIYGGELQMDANFVPSYYGGRNHPLVLKALKYDACKFSVNLVCRVSVGNNFIVSHVEDDEVCKVVLCQATTEFLIMYVEIEEISFTGDNSEPSKSIRNESSILEQRLDVITGPSMLEPVEEPYKHDIENQQMTDPPLPTTQSIPSDNFGYETMSSGSSEPFSDDDIDDHSPVVMIEMQLAMKISIGNEDAMVAENIYINTCRTAEEWDQEVEFDDVYEQVTGTMNFSFQPN
ncbi:hypothetical protein M5K25_023272 [Dendrobium thyrsiflorum]|uniref:Uncharacterized protein n=1 Tax=Dendrobium thyrsiflorum TaxID=117978 RepID=A0ABD0U7N5_DENTH